MVLMMATKMQREQRQQNEARVTCWPWKENSFVTTLCKWCSKQRSAETLTVLWDWSLFIRVTVLGFEKVSLRSLAPSFFSLKLEDTLPGWGHGVVFLGQHT